MTPKELKRFWKDMKWGREHHTRLLKEYKDKWVAIFQGQVVASGKALGKIQEKAKEVTGEEMVAVKFVECGAHIYALKN